jgi:hypothetical protein
MFLFWVEEAVVVFYSVVVAVLVPSYFTAITSFLQRITQFRLELVVPKKQLHMNVATMERLPRFPLGVPPFLKLLVAEAVVVAKVHALPFKMANGAVAVEVVEHVQLLLMLSPATLPCTTKLQALPTLFLVRLVLTNLYLGNQEGGVREPHLYRTIMHRPAVVAVPVWLELLPPQVCQALEDMVLLAFF